MNEWLFDNRWRDWRSGPCNVGFIEGAGINVFRKSEFPFLWTNSIPHARFDSVVRDFSPTLTAAHNDRTSHEAAPRPHDTQFGRQLQSLP